MRYPAIALGSLLAAFVISPVFGADLQYKAPPPVPYAPVPAANWTGFRIGGQIGYGQADFSINDAGIRNSNFVGGVYLGYDVQLGANFLLGLETDLDLSNLKATDSTGLVSASLPWFGTTRLRAGFLATPSLLLYGTGGVAYGRPEVTAIGATTVKDSSVGWAAGAGVQYMVSGIQFGAEYLHVELDGSAAVAMFTSKTTVDLGRLTVGYKF